MPFIKNTMYVIRDRLRERGRKIKCYGDVFKHNSGICSEQPRNRAIRKKSTKIIGEVLVDFFVVSLKVKRSVLLHARENIISPSSSCFLYGNLFLEKVLQVGTTFGIRKKQTASSAEQPNFQYLLHVEIEGRTRVGRRGT